MDRKIISLFLFLFFCNLTNGQTRFNAKITDWYSDRQGAVSISFDDACYSQYEYAVPILDKYNIKATFSIVGEWIHKYPEYSAEQGCFDVKKMGWDQVNELLTSGHEIAAHGYKHEKYNRHLSEMELVKQMRSIIDLIENNTNSAVYTMHYPYSYTSDKIIEASKKAGFLFCRTGRDSINPASPKNMNLLFSNVILNNNTPDNNEFSKWLIDAHGNWLILMYHHIFPENLKEDNILKLHNVKNTYSLYPITFEQQVKTLTSLNYWIAPISTIGMYIAERDNSDLTMRRYGHTLKITCNTNIDTSVYRIPLTLKIELPWRNILVQGSEQDGVYNVDNNQILIDIMPGSTIKIKRQK